MSKRKYITLRWFEFSFSTNRPVLVWVSYSHFVYGTYLGWHRTALQIMRPNADQGWPVGLVEQNGSSLLGFIVRLHTLHRVFPKQFDKRDMYNTKWNALGDLGEKREATWSWHVGVITQLSVRTTAVLWGYLLFLTVIPIVKSRLWWRN